MAFTLISAPDNVPTSTADWSKINDVLLTIGLALLSPARISGGYVIRGSVVHFAGAWYVTDSDTAIGGSASEYVKLTNNAGTVSASYTSSLTGVSWNKTWNGYYSSGGEYFIFDVVKAYGAGLIADTNGLMFWKPSQYTSWFLSQTPTQIQAQSIFIPDSRTTLTGTGTYTVPANVYRIKVKMIGPGLAGGNGSYGLAGSGGASGEELEFYLNVTPGQTFSYSITSSSTVFGSTTATAGGGYLGGKGSIPGSGIGYQGGNGGGYKAGAGGNEDQNGYSATNGYGGGGGGGGRTTSVGGSTTGGSGGLGTIIIE